MKTLKTIGIVLLGFIILVIIVAYLLPRHIHVERSATIPASPEVVFNQVNILKNWEEWSPWHDIDPDMEIVYSGPEMGAGASYSWFSSDPGAGQGKLTIIKSLPYSLITTKLDFVERGTATAQYTFVLTDEGTLMTWSMVSDMGNNPIGRYFGLFMDKMLGRDFEKGMENIKEIVASFPVHEKE